MKPSVDVNEIYELRPLTQMRAHARAKVEVASGLRPLWNLLWEFILKKILDKLHRAIDLKTFSEYNVRIVFEGGADCETYVST